MFPTFSKLCWAVLSVLSWVIVPSRSSCVTDSLECCDDCRDLSDHEPTSAVRYRNEGHYQVVHGATSLRLGYRRLYPAGGYNCEFNCQLDEQALMIQIATLHRRHQEIETRRAARESQSSADKIAQESSKTILPHHVHSQSDIRSTSDQYDGGQDSASLYSGSVPPRQPVHSPEEDYAQDMYVLLCGS